MSVVFAATIPPPPAVTTLTANKAFPVRNSGLLSISIRRDNKHGVRAPGANVNRGDAPLRVFTWHVPNTARPLDKYLKRDPSGIKTFPEGACALKDVWAFLAKTRGLIIPFKMWHIWLVRGSKHPVDSMFG